MNKLRIMSVFGTRPEAIKMCPLVKELASRPEIESLCCVTAHSHLQLASPSHTQRDLSRTHHLLFHTREWRLFREPLEKLLARDRNLCTRIHECLRLHTVH